MEAHADKEPWFGLEQEYTLIGQDGRPFGWPEGGYPAPLVFTHWCLHGLWCLWLTLHALGKDRTTVV